LKTNVSGLRLGPSTSATIYQGINYTGVSQAFDPTNDYINLCNVNTPSGSSWNDLVNSIVINPIGTSVLTPLTAVPAEGCIWLYIHCSVAGSISEGPAGILNWCGTNELDLRLLRFGTITNSHNNANMASNLSGVRLGPNTSARLYRWDDGVPTGETRDQSNNEYEQFCGTTPDWNDRIYKLRLSVNTPPAP